MFAPDAEAPRSAVLQACEKLCDSQRPAELGDPELSGVGHRLIEEKPALPTSQRPPESKDVGGVGTGLRQSPQIAVQGASQDLHEDSLVLRPCRQASAAQTAQPKPREDSTAEDARRRSAVTVADSKSAPMCRYEKRKAMHRLRALVWVESANRCTELFGELTRAKLEDEVMKVVRLRFRQQNQDIQLRLLRGEDVSADMLRSFEDPLVPRADLPADDVAAVEAENAEPADGDAEGENGYPLAKPKLNDKENGVRVLTARRLARKDLRLSTPPHQHMLGEIRLFASNSQTS